MTMNIISGLNSGCCGNSCSNRRDFGNDYEPNAGYGYGRNDFIPPCACASASRRSNRYCCNTARYGYGFGDERFGAPAGRYGYPHRHRCGCDSGYEAATIKILCTDEDCKGVCNTAFTLENAEGRCKTIDLKNCDRSSDIALPFGCTALKCIGVPRGFLPLVGTIFCEVDYDNCGRPVCTVLSEGCSEDRISVRREAGITLITIKFPRMEGSGCSDGCECTGL